MQYSNVQKKIDPVPAPTPWNYLLTLQNIQHRLQMVVRRAHVIPKPSGIYGCRVFPNGMVTLCDWSCLAYKEKRCLQMVIHINWKCVFIIYLFFYYFSYYFNQG